MTFALVGVAQGRGRGGVENVLLAMCVVARITDPRDPYSKYSLIFAQES